MFRKLLLALVGLAPASVVAHEFWLQPDAFVLEPGASVSIIVRIGEDLVGRPFPFDPRAYRSALWSGPERKVELSSLPSRAEFNGLPAYGTGLHSLTVSSFEQSLTYRDLTELQRFLKSVGQEELLMSVAGQSLPRTQITESYARSSKVLVHFGQVEGRDTRVSTGREWVALEDGFILFNNDGGAGGHEVQIYCKTQSDNHAVIRQDTRTRSDGHIFPDLPPDAMCLLNAVFVELTGSGSDLTSDWVSLLLQTPEPRAAVKKSEGDRL